MNGGRENTFHDSPRIYRGRPAKSEKKTGSKFQEKSNSRKNATIIGKNATSRPLNLVCEHLESVREKWYSPV